MLLEVAAKGRLMTKKAEPTTVATKHIGRTIIVSAITFIESESPDARLGVTVLKVIASTQAVVISLVFIVPKPFRTSGHLSNEIFAQKRDLSKSVQRSKERT